MRGIMVCWVQNHHQGQRTQMRYSLVELHNAKEACTIDNAQGSHVDSGRHAMNNRWHLFQALSQLT